MVKVGERIELRAFIIPVADDDRAGRVMAVQMAAENHPRLPRCPSSDHRLRTAAYFLSRLKDQPHGSRQVLLF